MVVGEGPGRQEDLTGRPFVGEAGQMLTDMLKAIGHPRETVFIANVVKCRPPGNRDPLPEEMEACLPYLERQIALIRPRAILSLGRIASRKLLETDRPISLLRGNPVMRGTVEVHPTFHPAYLLRNQADKKYTWEDLQRLRDSLEATESDT
jgi:DNA polymerase